MEKTERELLKPRRLCLTLCLGKRKPGIYIFENPLSAALQAGYLGNQGESATLVAGADRIKSVLAWHPRYDDLKFIVKTSLDWEQRRFY